MYMGCKLFGDVVQIFDLLIKDPINAAFWVELLSITVPSHFPEQVAFAVPNRT
jgi:hypothetical protein